MALKTLLVAFREQDVDLLPWARRIASRGGGDALGLLCVTEAAVRHLEEVGTAVADAPRIVQRALARLADDEASGVVVLDCRGPKPARAVLDAAQEFEAATLILPADATGLPGRTAAALQRLARAAPLDVLLLDPGAASEPPGRVIIPQRAGGGGFALRLAVRAFGESAEQFVLIADPAAQARSNRVLQRAVERLPENRRGAVRQITPDGKLDQSLAGQLQAGDLLLAEAGKSVDIRAQLRLLSTLRKAVPEAALALGVARSGEAAGPGRTERAIERLRRHLPRLDRAQRRKLHDLLDGGGRLSPDFVTMLMLSTGIATLGLIQSSTSVVVGAMLVAPLMTPILALGMSLVQANPQLALRAGWATALGIIAAMVTAMAIALLSPWSDLSAEVAARGSPNPFDLAIALLSGIAGSYALARPGAVSTLVGVAIAVALVPPLATVGIATVKGHGQIAGGAAILFLTNLSAIIAGSVIVFRVFGLDAAREDRSVPRWVRITIAAVIIALVPIAMVLQQNLRRQVQEGVQRAYARPLPAEVRDALRQRVARESGVEIVFMAQSVIERGFGVQVVLTCPDTVPPTLNEELGQIIRREMGDDVDPRVVWLRAAATGG